MFMFMCLILVEIWKFILIIGVLKNFVMMVLMSVSVELIFRVLKMNGIVIGRCSLNSVC